MGHYFHKCWIYIDSSQWMAPEREFLGLKRTDMKEYIRKHPMPPNSLFNTTTECMNDLLYNTGIITVSVKEKDESDFVRWYEGLIGYGK